MVERRIRTRYVPVLFGATALLWTACGPSLKNQTPVVTPSSPLPSQPIAQAAAPPAPAPAVDPVLVLIADADRHFTTGQKQLDLGHSEAARREFDRALNVLMESPYGGRTEPRIREYFDHLVDRISNYEVKALADGDGFTEQHYAPATIDELLALSTMFEALRRGGSSEHGADGSGHVRPRHRHPAQSAGAVLCRPLSGPPPRFHRGGLTRGSRYLPMIQNVLRAGDSLDLA